MAINRPSPTARTLGECRKRNWQAAVVEKWIPRANIRKDVWGFGDLLAVDDQTGALLIQATTTDHMAERVAKIREYCAAEAVEWLKRGNRIQVWGWALRGQAKRKRWSLRIVHLYLNAQDELCDCVEGGRPDENL